MENLMRAVRMHGYGGREVMVVEDTLRPEAGAGEVLVRVMAAGVNPSTGRRGRARGRPSDGRATGSR